MTKLKVRQGALDGAPRKAGGPGNRLMGQADGPVSILGGVAVEVEVNDERGRAAVVTHEVGQQAVEQVGVESHQYQ